MTATAVLVVTAYVVARDPACRTYTGLTALTGSPPHRGTVAVDPRRFPAGTTFDIPGYGHGAAEDRGGAIVGDRLDVAVATCAEAWSWGVRRLRVRITYAGLSRRYML